MVLILLIFNHAIEHTTASWRWQPIDLQNRQTWFEEASRLDRPIIVAEIAEKLVGYGSFGAFRGGEGYQNTVETSVYVDEEFQGQGIGKALLAAVIEAAAEQKIHTMMASVEAENIASIKLHAKFGFEEVACLKEVGLKFGRWLDLVLMQKML